jgi:hypothetical protein
MNRNIPLSELITTLESLSDMMQSPMLREASYRLDTANSALCCLEVAICYARACRSVDPTGDGERKLQQLIDDSEALIKIIREGGLYQ